MILRERVGGGGREKSALVILDCDCNAVVVVLLPLVATIAGGGNRKDISSEGGWDSFSLGISVDDTGVGGSVTRGIPRVGNGVADDSRSDAG